MEKQFKSFEEAMDYISNYDRGEIHKADIGNFTIRSKEDQEKEEHLRDHFFESETSDHYYRYTIEEFKYSVNLNIFSTYKHPMISAAQSGNLDQFIEHFVDTEKMKEFSLGLAVQHNQWNITEFLISNHQLKKNPTYWAIRYDNDVMIQNLLEFDIPLDYNWLAYCVYYDSYKVAQELLINRKCHVEISEEEYNTDWLKKELKKKDNKTVQIVRKILNTGYN